MASPSTPYIPGTPHYDRWRENEEKKGFVDSRSPTNERERDMSRKGYQNEIQNKCQLLWNPGQTGDQNNHDDRWAGRHIYSWDPNANGGQGQWGVSGKIKDGKSPTDPNFSADDIEWFSDNEYAAQSGDDMNYV